MLARLLLKRSDRATDVLYIQISEQIQAEKVIFPACIFLCVFSQSVPHIVYLFLTKLCKAEGRMP